MDIAFCNEIADRLDEFSASGDTRAVVLTGNGKCFSAGVNLKTVIAYDADDQTAMLRALNWLFLAAYSLFVPLIGAINGHAIAGGLILALTCDYRIGPVGDGQFGLTEVRAGVPYPVAAVEVVRNELQPSVIRNLVLRGKNGDAAHALQWGIFDELQPHDRLLDRAIAVADEYAQLPPVGFRSIKHQFRHAAILRSRQALEGKEPLAGNWLTHETSKAASSLLERVPEKLG